MALTFEGWRCFACNDAIDHPSHYTRGKIEVWDFILDQELSYLLGNIVKYVCRAGHKGAYLEDLKKARAYIEKAISIEEGDIHGIPK